MLTQTPQNTDPPDVLLKDALGLGENKGARGKVPGTGRLISFGLKGTDAAVRPNLPWLLEGPILTNTHLSGKCSVSQGAAQTRERHPTKSASAPIMWWTFCIGLFVYFVRFRCCLIRG